MTILFFVWISRKFLRFWVQNENFPSTYQMLPDFQSSMLYTNTTTKKTWLQPNWSIFVAWFHQKLGSFLISYIRVMEELEWNNGKLWTFGTQDTKSHKHKKNEFYNHDRNCLWSIVSFCQFHVTFGYHFVHGLQYHFNFHIHCIEIHVCNCNKSNIYNA